MLDPLFDKNCALVGWIDLDKNIFDTKLNWVSFIKFGHAWSLSRIWLGKINGHICLDREGNVVAWNPKDPVRSGLRSLTPLTPLMPLRPLKPLRPLNPLRPLKPLIWGNWSSFSFEEWIRLKD